MYFAGERREEKEDEGEQIKSTYLSQTDSSCALIVTFPIFLGRTP
jgi:hypothetical protein